MDTKTFVFERANIIPMDEERVLYDQTVVVRNGRIHQITDAANITIPTDAVKIDAAGQYLIPALADMHIHLEGQAWNIMFPPDEQFSEEDLDFSQILFPYIANGITTVQIMSALPEHIPLREQISRGEVVGPRLILNRMIDGPGQAWPPPICTWVETAVEARQAVLNAKEAGYDGMKVYSFLSQECYDAILTTAKELAMPVGGHIPNALSVKRILAAGQILIAHAEEVMRRAGGDFTPERIDQFANLIADNNAWITPTLTTTRNILSIFDDLDGTLSRPEIRSLHPMAVGIWSYINENIYMKMPPEHQQAIRNGFESFQQPFTKALHDKGVKLMTGTDALIPINIPGYSIHDELVELVEVGLTPYEALRTATTNPMEYLRELDDAGTIKVGKRTELVLLSANPLENIVNTKTIMGVMCRGNWLNREDVLGRMDNIMSMYLTNT